MKLTIKNQQQIDALKKIGSYNFGVNGGTIVMNGTELSIFQGNVDNFKQSELGGYSPEQLEAVFAVLDADSNGDLSAAELQAFAAMGEDKSDIIANDKNIIDETDFAALYDLSQEYVKESSNETDITNTQPAANADVDKLYDEIGKSFDVALDTLVSDVDNILNDSSKVNKNINTTTSGVKYDEKTGEYTVSVEPYKSGKVQDDGQGGKRYPNGSYWGIVTNAYPDLKESDKETVYKMIGEMNGFDWQNHTLHPGDNLKLPVLEYDENGRVKGYSDKSEVDKTEKTQASGSTAATSGTKSSGSTAATSGTKSSGSTAATSGTKASNTTIAEERATIGDNEALAAAQELRTAMAGMGTDEKTVSRILMESGYSTADIVKIMDVFENKYGETLMSDIQDDYSGKSETKLRNVLFDSTASEATQTLGWQSVEDIPTDIAQKANELYSQLESADATGYMKDFTKMSESEQAKIMLACDLLHPGESVMDRLTQDKVWFGKEDGYVDGILRGMKKVANTKS